MTYAPALPSTPAPTADAALEERFHALTLITAAVAAAAIFAAMVLGIPTWAAFLGWVGYSGPTTREGIANLISFLLGLGFGMGTGFSIDCLTPLLGVAATPLLIFGVTVLVISFRRLTPINNPLAYFLGLISIFASAQMPSISLLTMLAPAGALGAFSAWLVSFLYSRRLQRAA